MKYYLFSSVLLLAGPALAQTPAPPQPGSTNWYIFDQPLPDKQESKPVKDKGKEKETRIVSSKEAVQATTPATAPALTPAAAPSPAPPLPVAAPARRTRRPAAGGREYQGVLQVPLDPNTYRLIDRYAIKYGPDSLQDPHTSTRPYSRAATARLGERLLGSGADLSAADRFNAQYLVQDNWQYSGLGDSLNVSRRPFLTYFYRDQTDLYHVQTKDFVLRVNPVLLLQGGQDSGNGRIDGLRYVNTRGAAVEGTIDERLGFYAFLTENQEAVPGWVLQRIMRDSPPGAPIAPHEGYTKTFKTSGSAYDFFTARGGITYAATKHINVQLAHDRNFIGNGYRSLILSDYSTPYFFLKINTRIWKFNYQNMFAELTAGRQNRDTLYAKKYLALHHLSFDVTSNFNIGLFEAEVAGRQGTGLEIQYLNPVIFYRAIEQQLGSEDNAVLGLDFKWNIKHRAQVYGQLVLDEFKLSEVRSGEGWWGNKQAIQLGGKYLDLAGIRNLDLQLEFNYIRPYTYQHESPYTDYQHYQQPLAHPMGANLTELLGVLSYQPLPRLGLVAKAFYTVQGVDALATTATAFNNNGGNVLISYNQRAPSTTPGKDLDHGYRVGNGDKNRQLHADFTATYQPRLNLFLDATLIARHNSLDQPTYYGATSGNEVYASVALRWNIAQRLHEF